MNVLTISSRGMPKRAADKMRQTPGADFSFLASITGVREALRQEQQQRCAYCERSLSERPSNTKIEHFHPRSADFDTVRCSLESGAKTPEKSTVAWSNLLLVCNGKLSVRGTCDTSKGPQDVCADIHNPKRNPLPVATQATCDHTGRLTSATGDAAAQRVIDEVLNLNEPTLMAARKKLFADLMIGAHRAKVPHLTGKTPAQLARDYLAAAETKEFGSVYHTVAARLARR